MLEYWNWSCYNSERTTKLVMSLTSSAGGYTHLPAREGEIRDSVCNPAKAHELIGFVAETKIEKGLVFVVAQSNCHDWITHYHNTKC